MRINGYERTTRDVTIEVYPKDALKELQILVFTKLGLDVNAYATKEGFLAHDEHDGGGGHSWIDTIIDNKAPTIQELQAVEAFKTIRSHL